jgi:hypothetical protein
VATVGDAVGKPVTAKFSGGGRAIQQDMRRLVIIISIALASAALLAPSGSGAATAPGYYGSTEAGGEIAFGAKFNGKGKPTQVKHLRWANIPAACTGYPPTAHSGELKITMKVDSHGKFHGSGEVSTGAKVTISGRFKHHDQKATGTFRLNGTISGCVNADTGKLGWDTTKKP